MSGLYYPDLQMADLVVTPIWATEVVQYETGFSQRNALRDAPLLRFKLAYDVLLAAQYDDLLNFFHRHRGQFEAFWFRDYTDLAPTLRDFGVGNGITIEFKVGHDAMDACIVYVDGIPEPTATIDLADGTVAFLAAPAAGQRLKYSATNARYRVRFGNDDLASQRHKYIAWGGEVELIQVRQE